MKKLAARVLPALALVALTSASALAQTPISCTATHTAGPSTSDYISSVYLAGESDTLNNASGVGASDYTDFTALGTKPGLQRGGQYTLSVNGAGVLGAWIDFDHSGTLSAGEFLGDCSAGACDITFTVPCSATLGDAILRVVSQTDAAAGSGWETTQGACGTYASGEDEDYVVTLTATPSLGGLPASMCTSEAPVTLIGNTPGGGSFSTSASGGLTDNGDGTAVFDPAGAGIGGPYSVTYTDACGVTASSNVTVTAGTGSPSFTGLGGPYCPDAAQVALSPSGSGSFSGPGLTTQAQVESVCIYDADDGGPLPDTCAFTSNIVTEGNNPITSLQTSPSISLTGASSILSIDYILHFTACSGTSTFDFYLNGVLIDSWANTTNSCSNVGPGDFGYPYVHTVTGGALDANWNFGGTNTVAIQQNNTDMYIAGYGADINYIGAGGTAFDPALAGPGTHTIVYTETSGGCDNADVQTVTVLSPAPADLGPDLDQCLGSTTTLVATGGVSYTWNQGIGGGNNKVVAPTDTTEYIVTATDANGCTGTDTIVVFTHPLPTASFSGLASSYDQCDPVVTLTGSPAGGTFSGTGISGNTFDPGAAGVGGPYNITYTYTDAFSCMDDSVQQVTVNAFAGFQLNGLSGTYCEQEGLVILEGLPAGGAFTGTGVDTAMVTDTVCIFDGTLAGNCTPGNTVCFENEQLLASDSTGAFMIGNEITVESIEFLLYYAYDLDFQGQCTGPLADWEFFLNGTSIGTHADTNLECTCFPTGSFPLMHTVSGSNVSNNWNFNGTNNITVTQNSPALRSIVWKAIVHYSQAVFDPAVAGAGGPYTVTYTYNSTACSGSAQATASVIAAPTADAGMDATICEGQSTTISGSGGISQDWNQGLGGGANKTVSPTTTTEYILTTTAANSCTNTDTVTVTVNPLPSVFFSGLSPALPDCATPDTLTGTPAGGTFSGTGVGTNFFSPSAAGIGGPYAVIYTYTDGNNCTNADTQYVQVDPFTSVSFSGLSSTYCAEDDLATLVGTPVNGSFSGPGLTNAVLSDTLCIFDHNVVTGINDCQFDNLNGCLEGELNTTALESNTLMIGNEVSIDRIEFKLYFRTESGAPTFTFYLNGAAIGTFNSNAVHGSACRQPGDATYPATVTVTGAQLNANWNVGGMNTLGVQQNNSVTYVSGYKAIVFYEAGNLAAFDPAAVGVGGPYSITYTVNDGTCSGTDTQTVTAINAAPPISAGPDLNLCFGGSVTVAAAGGVSYTWDNGLGSGASHSVSPVDTTQYIVTGTGSNSCTAKDTVWVNANPPLAASAGNDQTICLGASTTITASGGVSYMWSNGLGSGASQSVSPATTTTYVVTVTDANNCTATDSLTITVNPVPQVDTTSMVVTNPPCGMTSGSITGITATGSGTVTYEWFDAIQSIATSANLSSIGAGTYTLVVTDAVCSTSVAIPVVNSGAPAAPTAFGGGSYCLGDVVPALSVTGSGGTYTWYDDLLATSQVGTGATYTPSQTTTSDYCVTETNAGCESLPACVNVAINPIPTANAGANDTICIGTSTTLTATGGSSYTWNNGLGSGASHSVSPAATTDYIVTVTDLGCAASDTVTIVVNSGPAANAGNDATVCQFDSAGFIAMGNGTPTWITPFGTIPQDTIGGPVDTVGVFNLVLQLVDANGCVGTDTVVLTAYPTPQPNLGADQSICDGDTIVLDASSNGLTYAWNNGLSADSVQQLTPTATADYQVTVTNGFACSGSDTVSVTVSAVPTIDTTAIVVTGSDCIMPTGSITGITATGSGLQYTWTNAADSIVGTSLDLTGVPGGQYILEVLEGVCAAEVGPFALNNIGAPAQPSVPTPAPYCDGDTPADLTATGTGGTISWYTDPGPSGIDGVGATYSPANSTDTYYVTETVAGCESQATAVTVTFNSLPTANAGNDQSICPGSAALLTATGGVSYVWSNGATTDTTSVAPLMATTYTVTVTDANSCSATDSVSVDPSGSLAVTTSSDTTICLGGTATISAAGGISYLWSNGDTTASTSVSPAIPTLYSVTATDASGCTGTADVAVTVSVPPIATAGPDTSLCDSGTVVLTATGGGSYLWSNSSTSASITVNVAATTTFTVTVTNPTGCSATADATVTVGAGLTATAGPDTTLCNGGSATLTATGGSSYSWSNGDTGASITVSPLATTTYTVTATDAGGCTGTATATVSVGAAPTVVVTNDTTICAGSSLALTASGATSYSWSNGDSGPTSTVMPTSFTTYTVTASDANGCTATATVEVSTIPLIAPICGFEVILPLQGGAEIAIVDLSQNANSWTYTFGDGSSSMDQNPSHTYADTGTYTITQYVYNTCSSDTCSESISLTGTGLAELNALRNLRIWPNPTRSAVNVELGELAQQVTYTLTDAEGRVVSSGSWPAATHTATLALNGEPAGVYILQLVTREGVTHKRITLQR